MNTSSLAAVPGRRSSLVLLAVTLFISGCAGPRVVTPEPPPIPEGGAPVPEQNEVVLSDDTQLIADAPWGRIKIEAGPGARRVYTWRGNRRGVVLEPRKTRFAGSMGIHYEGEPSVWEPADGISKVDLEEGQLRFDTVEDAMIWMQIRRLRYTYNNSGLVVGWRPDGDTLQVELWQFYIGGKQPTNMPKASDARISTGPLAVVPQKMKPVLVYEDGRRKPIPEPAATVAKAVSRPESADTKNTEQLTDGAESEEGNWFQRNIANVFGDDSEPDTNEEDSTE